MATAILMPKMGLTMKNATVVKWLKEEGDPLREKEPVMEIETEKLINQVESPCDGILLKKVAKEGERYEIAAVLGYVGKAGEAIEDAAPDAAQFPAQSPAAEASDALPAAVAKTPAAASSGKRVFISPLAKKLAIQKGIDFTKLQGSGPNGRIVKADILRAAEKGVSVPEEGGADFGAPRILKEIPYLGMRRAIGQNMLQSWLHVPMVTHHVNADATVLLEYYKMLNKGVEEKADRVSINDLLMKITAHALEKMPVINSSLSGEDKILVYETVNLGMATAVENGLIVPVLRNANKKSLLTISRELKDLAYRARNGGLQPEDMQGATFTVSNLGGYGSVDYFTPIVNPPQAAILGIGRVVEQAVPICGEIQIRPMLGLSFTYDHRVIDGALAAEFMKLYLKLLENPARSCS